MDYMELAAQLRDNPEMLDEIFDIADIAELEELRDALETTRVIDGPYDFADPETIQKLLDRIDNQIRANAYEEFLLEQDENEDNDFMLLDEALDTFYDEYPEMDDRPQSPIPVGMSVEEFSEIMGCTINEFGEIIRPAEQKSAENNFDPELLAWLNGENTPLKKREEQLSALEAEARTISEAEALINKQNKRQGKQVGE